MKRGKIDKHMIMEFIVPPICAVIGFIMVTLLGLTIYFYIWG